MSDGNGGAASSRPGYFQQYLARMAPAPLPPPPLPLPASSTRPALPAPMASARRAVGESSRNKAKPTVSSQRRTLVDAFKQHGMKLCDGAKLNAVAKGVTQLGAVPPTLGVHITALYLSQNDLSRLDGIEQFQNVRLLSVASNRIVRFADVERLSGLAQLRHLNLMGNPLCGHPNYRFRVVDTLRQLAVLDTVEISKQERALAPVIASQDRALGAMVMKNHMEIQKLQRIAVWIRVVGELHCGVLRDAVTGRYDQLPSPHADALLDTDRFVRLWQYEDTLAPSERDTLEAHMMAIIARTRAKLTEQTPQMKAKAMLFKLANASLARRGRLNELPPAVRREHCAWEDAYAHVLQLQQQTIATLRSECDCNRQEVLKSMRELVVMNPSHRRAVVLHDEGASRRRLSALHLKRPFRPLNCDATTETDPQACVQHTAAEDDSHSKQANQSNEKIQAPQQQVSLRRVLRSGQFGNKTLNEAIQSFSLRQPAMPKPTPSGSLVPKKSRTVQMQASESAFAAANDKVIDAFWPDEEQSVVSINTPYQSHRIMHEQPPSKHSQRRGSTTSETVCSSDTQYEASVGDPPSDNDSIASYQHNGAVVVASHMKHTAFKDELRLNERHQTHELKTVYEDPLEDKSATQGNQRRRSVGEQSTFHTPPPRFLTERQHELEAREEKYIVALVESEQRELDLRQEISLMHEQLARFQQLLSDNEHERNRIKQEINERASAVARPSLLRRYFVKWIHHHHWALQFQHIRRKRSFVVQHDAFWCWRRKVWARQQFCRIQKRQHSHLLRTHLTEWANLTRISMIAVHTRALRQSHLMKRIVDEWRQQTHVKKMTDLMIVNQSRTSSHRLLSGVLSTWRRAARNRRHISQLQRFYTRNTVRHLKQSVVNTWKIFVLTVARPRRMKLTGFEASQLRRIKQSHLAAWRRATLAERLHELQLYRKIWRAWRLSCKSTVAERKLVTSLRVETLKDNLLEWRRLAAERAAARRSLNIATRHLNHRWLRKLWMYWKIYSLSRKRYMQGASKARKHYVRKLLRRVWSRWTQTTKANLVLMKQKKQRELCYHFKALCSGVRIQRQRKKWGAYVSHAVRRRLLVHVRHAFTAWAKSAKRSRHCKDLGRLLTGNRVKSQTSHAWHLWKSQRLRRLQSKLLDFQRHNLMEAHRIKETEGELLALSDQTKSLAGQVRRLSEQLLDRSNELDGCRDELQQREQHIEDLEKELDEALHDLQQVRSERNTVNQRALSNQRNQETHIRELEEKNNTLCSRAEQLEERVAYLSRSLDQAKSEETLATTRLTESLAQTDQLRITLKERERALQETIDNLSKCLEDEQTEREETVQRLQEYEVRIASTCAEISDHEQAHEQECIKLRAENAQLDVLRKEAAVRSAELERLLSEKNEQIVALSIQLKDAERADKRTSESSIRHGNANDRGGDRSTNRSTREVDDGGKTNCNATAALSDDGGFTSAAEDSIICLPVKRVHNCILLTAPESCARRHGDSIPATDPTDSAPVVQSEEERLIDVRTSQIHADIQLLQERITKRLQQLPCVPSHESLARTQSVRTKPLFENDACSVSTVSESEQERDIRRTTRRTAVLAGGILSRSSTTSASAITREKRTTRSIGNRENSSRIANRTPATTTAQPPSRPRMTAHPPHRPLPSDSEVSKPKKRTSGRTLVKKKQTASSS